VSNRKANLYIDGYDFYRGSTKNELKNGWCDFRVLGSILEKRHFGSSFDVGKIWYVTNIDAPEVQYGQGRRKKLWLNALGAGVGPVIADYRKPQANVALGIEAVADAAESRPDEHQHTIVIAADPDLLSPTQAILSRYHGKVVVAIPPDLSTDRNRAGCGLKVTQIAPSDLEHSHLCDTISGKYGRYSWSEYLRSKDESKEVAGYCLQVWEAFGDRFERVLKPSAIHNSLVPDSIRCSLDAEVEKVMRRPGFDRQLSVACKSFVTQDMIERSLTPSSNSAECKYIPISDGKLGRNYLSLFGKYLANARNVQIVDPYLRLGYQVRNVEELLKVIREPRGCRVELVTSFDGREPWSRSEVQADLDALSSRLVQRGFTFSYEFDPLRHDREIVTEEWVIGLGRGLDMYYPPRQGTRRAKACNIFYMKKQVS
jgi:hypothetical protein